MYCTTYVSTYVILPICIISRRFQLRNIQRSSGHVYFRIQHRHTKWFMQRFQANWYDKGTTDMAECSVTSSSLGTYFCIYVYICIFTAGFFSCLKQRDKISIWATWYSLRWHSAGDGAGGNEIAAFKFAEIYHPAYDLTTSSET